MAEGLLRHLGDDNVKAVSAGTELSHIKPEAIEVMKEWAIDISDHYSKTYDQFLEEDFDIVITVCDTVVKNCPIFPFAKQHLHWSMMDPDELAEPADRLKAFKECRDELNYLIVKELLPLVSDKEEDEI
jgi:arsenate reductase